jgi:magnesium-transporting ATPase (P-type)
MSDIATSSLVLSSFVVLITFLLGWKEWSDRRDRNLELSREDARHFGHQNTRRSIGLAVMGLLAVGLVTGSRIPSKIGLKANPLFLGVWFAVFLLILLLLTLAMIDWLALRIFARRHRNAMLRERLEILREESRLRKARQGDGNGHSEGPLGDLFR